MSLNKTNGNMYPWVTHTWNPLAGRCQHGCRYCYMKKGFLGNLEKYKGKVELVEEELNTNLGSDKTIFVGSAIDLFGDWVPESAIRKILSSCGEFSNTYLFQSKNPARFTNFLDLLPESTILGTTLETNREYNISQAPEPPQRYQDFLAIDWPRKMISIEPIMDFDLDKFVKWIKRIDLEFVSIGADSKNNGLREPSSDKVRNMIKKVQEFTEIRAKKNLNRLLD
ncbi:hypothetical protein AKJ48_01605 [candidate division MSBL1 archaeon SCGC-AAA261O19]|uniref:DUF5131 family protein n=1 Tax=candidate division MSBL1 archaeon SCGC-AAA261O19 TaxID=1698277 RepID=A0A133VE62_9EURY|nr:hypothetical protein AKJ48_01605 [candidate division MSBL1 archaeon SCGC-AAA261O19]